MLLKGKKILIISPEAWGKIFISKHNYAIALAGRGNDVYFLNPVLPSLRPGKIVVEHLINYPNIRVISYNVFFPFLLKFHAKPLFEKLLKLQIRLLLKKLRVRFDIVWDFNCSYLYNDLTIFNAPLKIFHPVDQVSFDAATKKCDLIFSVSKDILEKLSTIPAPKAFINHGLSGFFQSLANEVPSDQDISGSIKVGYVGNLLTKALDLELLCSTIRENEKLDFHIIGPYTMQENNVAGYDDSKPEFDQTISFLKSANNVTLYGVLGQQEVADLIKTFDIFLLCYKRTVNYSNDNSHKILEYLSTGKVVVSTYMSSYVGSEMLVMTNEHDTTKLPQLLTAVSEQLVSYNSLQLQHARKQFALSNTYENHIKKIEEQLIPLVFSGSKQKESISTGN